MTEQPRTGEAAVDAQIDELMSDAAIDETLAGGHPAARETLDREEQLIRDAVLRMGALVEAAIRQASKALTTHDTALALDVIKSDALINEAQRGVSRLIAVTIATQQPVARDLRYLLTLDHVTYELERIGDHASSLAKQTLKLAPEPPLDARQVAVDDDEVDRLYHATFDEVLELMRRDPANVERGTRIIIASHYLERIGDRATNIAEDVVYLVTGDVEDLNP
jgi:phosphate transport system protein